MIAMERLTPSTNSVNVAPSIGIQWYDSISMCESEFRIMDTVFSNRDRSARVAKKTSRALALTDLLPTK
jgi:hypothetical protein